jgi:hypothetical protein
MSDEKSGAFARNALIKQGDYAANPIIALSARIKLACIAHFGVALKAGRSMTMRLHPFAVM